MPTFSDSDTNAMDRLIDQAEQLHSSPDAACKAIELLRTSDFEVSDVVECLKQDPALTSAILRLVNSSHYGLTEKVGSVQRAVTYMGRRSLRLAVLSFGLIDRLTKDLPAEILNDFWRRSLTMATASYRLVDGACGIHPDEAYCAGLLADLGVLALVQAEPDKYGEVYSRHDHGVELAAAERAEFGFDHAALGARLLVRWNIPTSVTNAITQHHRRDASGPQLVDAVYAADLLADVLWVPDSPKLQEIRELLEKTFGLDLDGFITLAVDCKEGVSQNAKMFGAHVSGNIDCEAILEQARQLVQEEALASCIELDSLTSIVDDHSA